MNNTNMKKDQEQEQAPKLTKNEKFRKLSVDRINKVNKALQVIVNLKNRNNYEYSQQEVDAIFEMLHTCVDEAKDEFNKSDIRIATDLFKNVS